MTNENWHKRLLILGIAVLSVLILAECVIIAIMLPLL